MTSSTPYGHGHVKNHWPPKVECRKTKNERLAILSDFEIKMACILPWHWRGARRPASSRDQCEDGPDTASSLQGRRDGYTRGFFLCRAAHRQRECVFMLVQKRIMGLCEVCKYAAGAGALRPHRERAVAGGDSEINQCRSRGHDWHNGLYGDAMPRSMRALSIN